MNDNSPSTLSWLEKARNDLRSARVLLDVRPAIRDTASFHCQQSGEKALKAYLVCKGVEFEKTHNMSYLINLCMAQDGAFAELQDYAETLIPFAVEVRYPGDVIMPSLEESADALKAAEAIWGFVLAHISS